MISSLRRHVRRFRGGSSGRGFAALVATFLIVTFAALGLGAVAIMGGSAELVSDEYRSQQAFNIAQAGLTYIAKELENDPYWYDNTPVTKDFGPGSFTVTFEEQTPNSVVARVSGTVAGVELTRTVQQSLTKAEGFAAFQNAIYGGQAYFGSSTSGTVTGDVTAGWNFESAGSVVLNGDVISPHEEAQSPFPDWSYWENVATTVLSGEYTYEFAGTYEGIYYVDGTVIIAGDTTFNGTLVARGGPIVFSGPHQALFTANDPNPALIAMAGIYFSDPAAPPPEITINGWVVGGYESIEAESPCHVTVRGGLTSQFGVYFNPGPGEDLVVLDITHVPPSAPPPGFTDVGEPAQGILFGEWREVY